MGFRMWLIGFISGLQVRLLCEHPKHQWYTNNKKQIRCYKCNKKMGIEK
jgi:hypothetical protein